MGAILHYSTFAQVALFALTAFAAPTSDTAKACSDISAAISGKTLYPGQAAYRTENRDYYNIGLAELGPACIAMPTSAQEVSSIVKVLNAVPSVPFAVKSGGHDPNPGHSSVRDGVLIALKNINAVKHDSQRKVVHLGPGNRWGSVLRTLAKEDVTVVSGRIGVVGVGGLLSQGGNSYLSSKYGLAADNIVEWETVLANGTIANIKASEQPELARAMRGGGNQFGITTKFTVRSYPLISTWGGTRVYAAKDRKAVFEALADFIENNHKDPNAAIIFTAAGGSASVMFAYQGASPPKGAFGKFENLKPTVDGCKTTPYPTLVGATDVIMPLMSIRTSFRSITLPHLPHNHGWYEEIDSLWANITKTRGSIFTQSTLAFQPFNHIVGQATEERGGNSMGLKGTDGDRFVIEIAGLYGRAQDDKLMQDMGREFTEKLEKQAERLIAEEKTKAGKPGFETYLPHFMNDAGPDQDVLGTYKEKNLFVKLQKEIDPNGFFAKRAGGYSYQKV